MVTGDYRYPCSKCGVLTGSFSGVCVRCRAVTCKGCGKIFAPRRESSDRYCSHCVKTTRAALRFVDVAASSTGAI
jgi:hypothetical protein